MRRPFRQIDVFTDEPYRGNPVAVVHEAEGIDDEALRRFARWTNLSETTFLLPPTTDDADYRVRIFTPAVELPFAGHPTLGTCHAWLEAGGVPRDPALVIQECAAGLIRIRRDTANGRVADVRVADRRPGNGRLAFAEPPLIRGGPVDDVTLDHVADVLRIPRPAIVDAQWADNGPGWIAVLLGSAAEVLAIEPAFIDLDLGVVGPHPAGSPTAFEVRAFFPLNGATVEDPVTGSLNASVAGWLLRSGRATAPYVASQGTALGRAGRVEVSRDGDGTIWIGGGTVTCIVGEVDVSPVVPPSCHDASSGVLEPVHHDAIPEDRPNRLSDPGADVRAAASGGLEPPRAAPSGPA